MEANLAARSQAVRGATLRLLCLCAQPLVPQQKSSSKDEAPPFGEPQRLSSIFPGLAQIESQVCVHRPTLRLPLIESGVSTQHAMKVKLQRHTLGMQACTLENGRAAANMLSGLKTAFEYSQVPLVQIQPVICALLGLLHIRCHNPHASLGLMIRGVV